MAQIIGRLILNNQILVILDNIRSLYNVGAIMRSMDCVDVQDIYLCGITPTPKLPPHYAGIKKTALAGFDNIFWRYFKNTRSAINGAKRQGYKVYIIEQNEQSIMLEKAKLKFPGAFVFGHETEGVNVKLFDLADEIIQLPNCGASHSWNVASTASIVLYEAWKRLKKE